VPFSHSLHAFNAVVPPQKRLSQNFIDSFYKNMTPPIGTPKPEIDPIYGKKVVLYRKVYKNVRVTIFDGKHEFMPRPGLNWLLQQKKGVPAQWTLPLIDQLNIWKKDTESGK
jgi:hypothetical protein